LHTVKSPGPGKGEECGGAEIPFEEVYDKQIYRLPGQVKQPVKKGCK